MVFCILVVFCGFPVFFYTGFAFYWFMGFGVERVVVPKRKKRKGNVKGRSLDGGSAGRTSRVLNELLEKHGLLSWDDLKGLPTETAEQIVSKGRLLQQYALVSKALADLVGSSGRRGFAVLDKLIDIRGKILEREEKLRREGRDPLEDSMLLKWHQLELDMMKFLEKMKFDVSKASKELELKEQSLKLEELDASAWKVETEGSEGGVNG